MSASPALRPAPRCIFDGCVATWRHWHGFLPGGYDDPDNPGELPIYFTDPDPDPTAVRDYNGAALTPESGDTGWRRP